MEMKPYHYWLLGPGGLILILVFFDMGVFSCIFALAYILWLRRKARLGGWLPRSAGKGDELERLSNWVKRKKPVRTFVRWLIK
jgi:hypothetical protein